MLMNGQVTVGSSAKEKASYEIMEEMKMAAEPENQSSTLNKKITPQKSY